MNAGDIDLIRERYEPLEVVGRGGQGQVFRALDHQHGRHVALKVRRVRSASERDALLHEARILLDLEPNPNLPLVRDDFFEDEGYYIVMEWIEGKNLQKIIGERGPLPLADVAHYLEQVASALDHLHEHDPPIVHKDVKPSNVIVGPTRRAVLVDFGISSGRRGSSPGDYGTTGFHAPETVAGAEPGPAADIFGLAATAFALLAGGPPAPGQRRRWLQITQSHPKHVSLTLRRGLAFDPSRRPRSARELIASLRSQPSVPNNLPVPLTSFVGRERETSEMLGLLRDARLVTLTGAGGVGKTRLALHLATESLAERPDGAWIVELAELSDGRMLAPTVSSALGVREAPGRSPEHSLEDHVATRDLLLVLDNCEHLAEACAEFAASLLRSCRNLRILATSRAALGADGERLWPLAPLGVPESGAALAQLRETDAVALFVDRALQVRSSFELEEDNAQAVADICRRLDGIPLAIELAAAEIRVLPPQQIAERLEDRLGVGRAPDAIARHTTLRAAVDWSYELLSSFERTLYRRLSVFSAGFTLEAAEAVCASYGLKVYEVLAELVDRSLVVAEERGGRARYRMLETVRQHAREMLAASGEEHRVRARHLDWFVSFAEEAQPQLQGPELARWVGLLDPERDNIRAALEWGTGPGDAEGALMIASALWHLWWTQGSWNEGRRWLDACLAACENPSPTVRARALLGSGALAYEQGEPARARVLYEESLDLARRAGDHATALFALNNLAGVARAEGDYAAARQRFEETLGAARHAGDGQAVVRTLLNIGAIDSELGHFEQARVTLEQCVREAREAGSPFLLAAALHHQGSVAAETGTYAAAEPLLRECVDLSRELGDRRILVSALNNLGSVKQNRGELDDARLLLDESRTVAQEMGDPMMLATAQHNLGVLARISGDRLQARALLDQAVASWRELGNRRGLTETLNEMGTVALLDGDDAGAESLHIEALAVAAELGHTAAIAHCLEGLSTAVRDAERAARLFGAASALRESIGIGPLDPAAPQSKAMEAARDELGPQAFTAAWEAGREMTAGQAVEEAKHAVE